MVLEPSKRPCLKSFVFGLVKRFYYIELPSLLLKNVNGKYFLKWKCKHFVCFYKCSFDLVKGRLWKVSSGKMTGSDFWSEGITQDAMFGIEWRGKRDQLRGYCSNTSERWWSRVGAVEVIRSVRFWIHVKTEARASDYERKENERCRGWL